MRKNTFNILLVIITIGLFSLNFTPVFAQQMLIQILGGGYRLDGPALIDFPAQTASVTDVVTSERSIRDVADPKPYLQITDENGGQSFNVQISALNPLESAEGNTIDLSNFLVKNRSGTGNNIDTLQGREDGLVLNPALDDYIDLYSLPNDLTTTRIFATGTGKAPWQGRIYPGFRIDIPAATAIGIYQTEVTITII